MSDGMPHSKEELHGCLNDDQAQYGAVKARINELRKKLIPRGEDIICQKLGMQGKYIHVRLLCSPDDD